MLSSGLVKIQEMLILKQRSNGPMALGLMWTGMLHQMNVNGGKRLWLNMAFEAASAHSYACQNRSTEIPQVFLDRLKNAQGLKKLMPIENK